MIAPVPGFNSAPCRLLCSIIQSVLIAKDK
jgi:hypothetical protein